ncbi:hypothetical protein BOTBODRAFT_298492 [Botryobasidium botryosum FD-172 SS1]|uniref:Protein kinase domain-containing protein n=1 Tax=Botryobasidium botryosum (strain FD-172 SS1) TaxID=930990 RepID=A0A067MU34_BOTB1|nr:hypothetical protein BOTBODRAFT_298492 [Botryobasidium botryosum FD-172 SS1]
MDDNTVLTIIRTMYVQWCPFGRGTAVYEVEATDGRRIALKISRPYASRPHEYVLLEKARQALGDGVPIVYGHGAGELVSTGPRQILAPNSIKPEEDRRLHMILMEVLHPLHELTGAQYLGAWIEIVNDLELLRGHEMLHRDISSANLMYRKKESKIRGVLGDFDLSSDLETKPTYSPHLLHRTGTTPFLAREMFVKHDYVPHLLRHDIESAIYVLIWDAVCRASSKNGGPNNAVLLLWLDPNTSSVAKGSLMDYLAGDDIPLAELEPIRRPLRQVIRMLGKGYIDVDWLFDNLGKTRTELNKEESQTWESMCGHWATDE